MDEEVFDQSLDSYLSSLDERRNNTDEQKAFNDKLKDLREAVSSKCTSSFLPIGYYMWVLSLVESTMTQMGQGSQDRVTAISVMLKDVCDIGVGTLAGELVSPLNFFSLFRRRLVMSSRRWQ